MFTNSWKASSWSSGLGASPWAYSDRRDESSGAVRRLRKQRAGPERRTDLSSFRGAGPSTGRPISLEGRKAQVWSTCFMASITALNSVFGNPWICIGSGEYSCIESSLEQSRFKRRLTINVNLLTQSSCQFHFGDSYGEKGSRQEKRWGKPSSYWTHRPETEREKRSAV